MDELAERKRWAKVGARIGEPRRVGETTEIYRERLCVKLRHRFLESYPLERRAAFELVRGKKE